MDGRKKKIRMGEGGKKNTEEQRMVTKTLQ